MLLSFSLRTWHITPRPVLLTGQLSILIAAGVDLRVFQDHTLLSTILITDPAQSLCLGTPPSPLPLTSPLKTHEGVSDSHPFVLTVLKSTAQGKQEGTPQEVEGSLMAVAEIMNNNPWTSHNHPMTLICLTSSATFPLKPIPAVQYPPWMLQQLSTCHPTIRDACRCLN